MAGGKPYYLTTPIYYVNSTPHIGHAYTTCAADILVRHQKQRGAETFFLTGVDEHATKVFRVAQEQGLSAQEYVDSIAGSWRDLAPRLNAHPDFFIRTSDEGHKAFVRDFLQRIYDNGDVYEGVYAGFYCVGCEEFKAESELVDGKCPIHDTVPERIEEKNYFFRLSKYQQPLLDHYAANPDFVRPESRRNEVVRFVEGGLTDLSISRTSFDWGVPVPGSDGHVMYVWLDALTNYITGLGYPDDTELWRRFWPADVHLIGKDVVRFHAVYWPAFLMSAGIALPKEVYGHGFLLSRGEKMSKSVGNVVDPMVLADRFGVDALRYFLLREVPFGQDGSYSAEAIVNRANAELANSFGNLAQRTLSMVYKNLGGVLPPAGEAPEDRQLLEHVRAATDWEVPEAFGRFAFSVGIDAWLKAVFACNAYVDTQAPWALRKTDPDRMAAVLGTLVAAVRALARAIAPIIPASADKLLTLIDAGEGGAPIPQPIPLFPRLELEAEEAV